MIQSTVHKTAMPTGSADYHRYVEGDWRGFARDDLHQYLADRQIADILSPSRDILVRSRPNRWLFCLTTGRGVLYIKRTAEPGQGAARNMPWLGPLFRGRSLASATLRISLQMRACGLLVPPIVLSLCRGSGNETESLVVTDEIEGRSLTECLRSARDTEDRDRRLSRVAGQIAQLHSRRFLHGDLLPGNIIMTRQDEVVFLDNDRTRRWPIVLPGLLRQRNLSQIVFRLRRGFGWQSAKVLLRCYFDAVGSSDGARRRATRAIVGKVRRRHQRRVESS